MSQLLRFYYGSHPDHKGRMLAEVLRQDDHWLEVTHDYIQWIFPLADLSRASANAPLLDAATIEAFKSDELLRGHMRAAFVRMLAFYGLTVNREGIARASNWQDRKTEWFTSNTHNSLRLTRMLKSLFVLGFAWEARTLQALLETLCATDSDCGIATTSRRFWQEAIPAA